MQTFFFYLRIILALIGGWFAIVLWFLLLNVGKSPVNQFMVDNGIIPLMTHSNVGGMLNGSHFLLMIQSILVFSSGGFIAALIAKYRELVVTLILGVLVILTCIIWDSNINCRVYYAIDLFIWFFGFLLIMTAGYVVKRKRLLDNIARLLKLSRQNKTGRSPVSASDKQDKS